MVHYFTKLSYILCILLGRKRQILLRTAHGWWRKRTLRGHSWGLPAPFPSTEAFPQAIWASHLLWVLAASKIFLLEWKNTSAEAAAAAAPTR